MEHHFNTQIAKDYGIEEAILMHNFFFWLSKNAANEKHFHDGLYWLYNSKRAFVELFPYMNETKIYRVIKHLEEKGLVVKGNYNEDKWDKTNWYAITKDGLVYMKENGYDIGVFKLSLQNDNVDSDKVNDGALQSEQCILINTTDSNTYTNTKEKDTKVSTKKDLDALFEQCWVAYKRKGSKKIAKTYWVKLTEEEKQMVLPHIKAYVTTRETNYQRDFERYLKDKLFLSVVFKGNQVVYDPARVEKIDSTTNVYAPSGNFSIFWHEQSNAYLYIGHYYDGMKMADGYTDENRPNGATLVLNNARGTIKWDSLTKKWNKV